MKQKIIKFGIVFTTLFFMHYWLFAQARQEIKAIVTENGSFQISVSSLNYGLSEAKNNLNNILSLSNDFSFSPVKERKDKNGIVHSTLQQYYKSVIVENGTVLIHSKNNIVASINGKIMTMASDEVQTIPAIMPDAAIDIAKKDLKIISTTINTDPVLVICHNGNNAALAYKIRINGATSDNCLAMYNVYVNALNGKVIKKLPLMAHADVQANAETYYSGVRQITTDSYAGGYRLRDNARKIETYNVKGIPYDKDSVLAFANPIDISNNTTTWGRKKYLANVTLDKAADSLKYTGLYDPAVAPVSGWFPRHKMEELTGSTYTTIKNEHMLPNPQILPKALTLPLTFPIGIPINTTEYKGSISKDSGSLTLDMLTYKFKAIVYKSDTHTIDYVLNNFNAGVNTWTNANGDKGTYKVDSIGDPAVDVHWGLGKTYDFFKSGFNYYSYDNDSNSIIRGYYAGTETSSGTKNNALAFPAPQNATAYGEGDGETFNPFVSLDITAHEFTHLVTGSNSNLEYKGESGALNESFSDMMGAAVTYFAKGATAMTWNIGDGIFVNPAIPYMRSLVDPKGPAGFTDTTIAKPQPHTYKGQYWASTDTSAEDNGGVHTNSGVGNKWFYLLAQGGSGTNDNQFSYNITPIGIDKAQNIAFTTFTNYLNATSGYYDAYTQSLQASEDIYGKNSTEYQTVKAAWKAVGIPKENTDVSIFSKQNNELQVYPNPATIGITIKSSIDRTIQADLYDIVGRRITSVEVKNGNTYVDLSALTKGVYILKYDTQSAEHAQRIILQ